MKNLKLLLSTVLLMLVLLPAHAQIDYGLQAGLNGSYFTGGDKYWSGTRYMNTTLTGGIYATVTLDKTVFVQAECNYMMTGAYNPAERTSFRVMNIVVPVTVGIKLNQFDIQAGVYSSFVTHAENYNYDGVWTFDWKTGDWGDYYKLKNGGGVVSVGYDFIGVRGQVRAMQSVFKVQHKDFGDNKHLGRDMIVNIEMYVPIKTFRE